MIRATDTATSIARFGASTDVAHQWAQADTACAANLQEHDMTKTFWPDDIRLVISISMQLEAGGEAPYGPGGLEEQADR